MLAGIPAFAVICPYIFFGNRFGRPPYFTLTLFGMSLLISFVIWIGNRYIMIWARARYPDFAVVRRRLTIQGLVMVVYTFVANSLLSIPLDKICPLNHPNWTKIDIAIVGNFAALFCTVTVVSIYESIYFMGTLKKSIEEKEGLKRESLVAQWNALKTQINPHFLFNNLNTLSSIIPDNPDQAVAFSEGMARVYRHILDVKEAHHIPLREELDVLVAYAFLLRTRFADNLDVDIRVAAEALERHIVPLGLQILVENAIKHNIVSAARPLRIEIFSDQGKLIVRNNLQKKRQAIGSTGIGLDNIRSRYRLLGTAWLPNVNEDGGYFTVSLPLIDPKYGSADH